MISNDDNPPSKDPKSYPNFVAFEKEDIAITGAKDDTYCPTGC